MHEPEGNSAASLTNEFGKWAANRGKSLSTLEPLSFVREDIGYLRPANHWHTSRQLMLLHQSCQGGPEWVRRFGHKWDTSGTFSHQISVYFGSLSQNVLKSHMNEKSP